VATRLGEAEITCLGETGAAAEGFQRARLNQGHHRAGDGLQRHRGSDDLLLRARGERWVRDAQPGI
jgi:hypothetical protein